MCTARKCYKGILCSIYWIVSIKKSFLFLLLLFIWSPSIHCCFFFSYFSFYCSVFLWSGMKNFSSSFSLSCLYCFSSGLFIQSLSGRMHLRGRWCAPFKRNANGKTTLRRAGGGWPDAQVLDLTLDMHCLNSLHFYLSHSRLFIFYLLLLNLNLFFQWPEKRRKRCQKIQDRAPEYGWEKDFQSNDTLGPHMYLYRPLVLCYNACFAPSSLGFFLCVCACVCV